MIKNIITGRCDTSSGPFAMPVLPNGPLAGPTKIISVTTTAQDVEIPEGTGLVIVKVMLTSACGYVGYRFKTPDDEDAVVLGNNGNFLFSIEPGRELPEAPPGDDAALSIACNAGTASAHVFFRT